MKLGWMACVAVTVSGVGGANTSAEEGELLYVKLLDFLLVGAAKSPGHGKCPFISS